MSTVRENKTIEVPAEQTFLVCDRCGKREISEEVVGFDEDTGRLTTVRHRDVGDGWTYATVNYIQRRHLNYCPPCWTELTK